MNAPESKQLRSVMAEVAQQLVAVDQHGTEAFVRVPLLYPSGASVVVRVREEGDTFFVSDFGMGWDEVEMMGASARIYSRHAKIIAENAGVHFDERAFFVLRVSKPQLVGAIVTIANCSQESAAQVAYALAEKRTVDENDVLYTRLKAVFEPRMARVERGAILKGASTHDWPVGSLVISNENRTVFEAVTNYATSVAKVVTEFGDLGRLDGAPARVAVVKSKSELGTYLGLLSPVGNIIESKLADSHITKLVRAA
ncbi:MAG: hypothetical protein P4L87_23525 [Formivibrio sp.]|nr:hypothetical protein [Formivibrio sp.]